MTSPPPRAVPEVRLTFDEAAILLALLELLPVDATMPDLAELRVRGRERLRTRMIEAVRDVTARD